MSARKGFYFLMLFLAWASFGCAAPKMYYWGDYSNSLYSCRKTPNEANLLRHKQLLENIVEESNKQNLRVPPGVYSELGYIYFRQNRNKEAVQYFGMEERIYPESTVFMERLIQAAKAREDDSKK